MGQKTHPVGFRLGIIRDWNSKWYEDKNYAAWLHEDVALRKVVKTSCTVQALAALILNAPPAK